MSVPRVELLKEDEWHRIFYSIQKGSINNTLSKTGKYTDLTEIECSEKKFPLTFKSIVPIILAEPIEEYVFPVNDIL